ncbi:MAG: MiaB/RimO family radical SAM methylthiotransferase [Dehalococcoidales bacterium]|nr:MAG: MiaB/RimO family radical SAM methylthiotransferase [Dehalococcoidales bacterium]
MQNTGKSYHIWTIGCQMNKAESERLASFFEQAGYTHSSNINELDLIVLNSCVVRQSAESRVTNKISSLKAFKKERPQLTIAVTGCYVNSDIDTLKKKHPHVDYFFKPGETPYWLEQPGWEKTLHGSIGPAAYVPITQGCNNFCSYCIVPYRRGREKSRLFDDIVTEVQELTNSGVREVTLLGQNVDTYGQDLPGKPDLADLLKELDGMEGLFRLRFLTNHPKDMSEKLIGAIASLDKVCEQINLPVQAGDNEILKLMRRDYTVEHYRRLIEKIRSKIPTIALSTDVIVGFPSESEQQFRNTFDLLADIRFDTVHIAAYSPREGTIAARDLEDDVTDDEKKYRLNMLEELQEKIATEINAELLGKTVEILVEGRKKGKWQGRTRSDKLVFFRDNENHLGKLVTIEINKTSPWSLQGKIIKGNNLDGEE